MKKRMSSVLGINTTSWPQSSDGGICELGISGSWSCAAENSRVGLCVAGGVISQVAPGGGRAHHRGHRRLNIIIIGHRISVLKRKACPAQSIKVFCASNQQFEGKRCFPKAPNSRQNLTQKHVIDISASLRIAPSKCASTKEMCLQPWLLWL